MDAFDADVLIYSAVPGHPPGRRVADLFRQAHGRFAGVGSALLLPEVLSKPLRDGGATEVRVLAGLLARLDLRPVDRLTSPPRRDRAVRAAELRSLTAVTLARGAGAGAPGRGRIARASIEVVRQFKLLDAQGRTYASNGEDNDAD